MALGVRAGNEVITTPFSFMATAETIALLGTVPVLCGHRPTHLQPGSGRPGTAINPRTRAIIPVSLFGQPGDFPAINAIAERHGLPVIEDGTQSFGARQQGQRSGGLSTIGTTSFYLSKPLGAYGNGGACFTRDGDLAARMRRISQNGQSRRYFHTDLGVKAGSTRRRERSFWPSLSCSGTPASQQPQPIPGNTRA